MRSAGKLRHRVVLLRKTRTTDHDGNGVTAWAPVGNPIRADVEGIDGREAVIGRALQGIASFEVTVRFRPDIGTADQLGYGDLTLNIRSATDPDGRRRWTRILADTGSAEATS